MASAHHGKMDFRPQGAATAVKTSQTASPVSMLMAVVGVQTMRTQLRGCVWLATLLVRRFGLVDWLNDLWINWLKFKYVGWFWCLVG